MVGLTISLFDGFKRLVSFCRSIHSRWASVTYADPVRRVKFEIMILQSTFNSGTNAIHSKILLPSKQGHDHDGPQQVEHHEKDRIRL